jgi:hypothetical protein
MPGFNEPANVGARIAWCQDPVLAQTAVEDNLPIPSILAKVFRISAIEFDREVDMLVTKVWSGAVTAVAVVAFAAFTSWASVAKAALSDDVNAALSTGTQAQKISKIQALAAANAKDHAKFTELVQLVATGASQQQVADFAGALAVACGASGNNGRTTSALVNTLVTAYPAAGGAIVGNAISGGCSAEVAANTLQQALLTAAGQFLSLRQVIPDRNPGPGVNLGQESFVKSLHTTRLGSRRIIAPRTALPPQRSTFRRHQRRTFRRRHRR